MAIGVKLNAILQAKGMKPGTLANLTGINKNTIYSIIKRDNDKVNMGTLNRIADALGITIDYFFDSSVEDVLTEEKEKPAVESGLSEKEHEFIELYSSLTPANRTLFLEIAQAILKAQAADPGPVDQQSGTP